LKRRKQSPGMNPVAAAMLRTTIRRDPANLMTDAELHAWNGENAAKLLNAAGRLVYITLGAAEASGFDSNHPDIRICLGMGSALGDLNTDSRLEFHRGAIQAGLLAIERLLPNLNPMSMASAALHLDAMVNSPHGMGTADLHALFKHNEQRETT
jgi:hypothetical protein